jgi:hypothetical protein
MHLHLHLHHTSKASAYTLPPHDRFRSHLYRPLRVSSSSGPTARCNRHVLFVHAAAAFRQQRIPGKGVGLIAAQDTAAGSVLLHEDALVVFTATDANEWSQLNKAVRRLSKPQRATYYGLANSWAGTYSRARHHSHLSPVQFPVRNAPHRRHTLSAFVVAFLSRQWPDSAMQRE